MTKFSNHQQRNHKDYGMKLSVVLTVLSILFTVAFQSRETSYFEGSITYVINSISEDGLDADREPLINEVYIKPSFYKFKINGRDVSEIAFGEVIASAIDSSRYSVNHFTHTKQNLGMEQNVKKHRLKSLKFMHMKDSILGYHCKKYEIYRMDHLTGIDLIEHVWIAEDLKISDSLILAKIFGYQNSILRDGSLPGIVMKSETMNSDGSVTTIQATEIRPMSLEDRIFSVPISYTTVN